jgi:integrase
MSTIPDSFSPPLRLFAPDPSDDERIIMDGISLSAWFRGYFLPVVMQSERQNSPETIAMYVTAVDYWDRCGAVDKPLEALTKADIATFDRNLAAVQWTRGPAGEQRTLSDSSVFKQVAIILRICLAAFEEGILRKKISYKRRRPRVDRKEAYTLAECRAIWSVLDQARLPAECPNRKAFWQALVAALFFTGMRVGAALSLRQSMFSTRKGQRWLVVPGSVNRKTHKEWEGPVHPQLAEAVAAITTDELFPQPWRQDSLSKESLRLAALAGVQPPMAFHVWRRVHAEQLGELGAVDAIKLAQASLQHASASTTVASYYDPRLTYMLLLPRLDG